MSKPKYKYSPINLTLEEAAGRPFALLTSHQRCVTIEKDRELAARNALMVDTE